MTSSLRQKRLADRLQAEISALIQQEMNDPRLSLVSVTRVKVDRELAYANVFVSTAAGDEERPKEVLQVLEGAKGYIRREISRRVPLRRTPEIIFHWDPSPEKAEQVSQVLDELKAAEETAEPDDDDR